MGRVDAESAQEFNGGINPWQLMVQGCVAVRGGAGAAAGEGRGAGEGGGQQRQSRGLANPGRHRQVPPAAPLPVRSRHRHRRRGRCLGPRRHGVQPRRQSHLVPPCPGKLPPLLTIHHNHTSPQHEHSNLVAFHPAMAKADRSWADVHGKWVDDVHRRGVRSRSTRWRRRKGR